MRSMILSILIFVLCTSTYSQVLVPESPCPSLSSETDGCECGACCSCTCTCDSWDARRCSGVCSSMCECSTDNTYHDNSSTLLCCFCHCSSSCDDLEQSLVVGQYEAGLLAFLCGILRAFVFVCGLAFGQAPDNVAVDMEPLVDFGIVIEEISAWFTDALKENWAFFLSLFFAWFSFMCLKSFLDGRYERRMARLRRHERVTEAINRAEERAELKRQRLEFESEYRNRRQQRFVLGENESYVVYGNRLYVREVNSAGAVVGYSSFEQWRGNRDVVQPIHLDENDDDGFYADEVRASYVRGVDDVREYDWSDEQIEGWLEEEREESDGAYRDWLGSGVNSSRDERRRSREDDDDLGLDSESDFEREYGNRRGEFRGGY